MRLVALAVVILILLPAISMTDDLIAAQNPAEVDCCVRRDHDCSGPHSIAPAAAVLPQPSFAGIAIAVARLSAPSNLPDPLVEDCALASVQNRPPPAA